MTPGRSAAITVVKVMDMALPGKDHHDPVPGHTPGSTATTADGEVLGSLKGATETSFKVDAENARGYWLNRDTTASAEAGALRLNFTRDRLEDFKLGDPGHRERGPRGRAPD